LGDVHDFILNNLGGVSDAQLFRAEHVSHIHHCLHDLLIFTINKYQKSKLFSNKNTMSIYSGFATRSQ